MKKIDSNTEELFDALSDIDEEYIKEADSLEFDGENIDFDIDDDDDEIDENEHEEGSFILSWKDKAYFRYAAAAAAIIIVAIGLYAGISSLGTSKQDKHVASESGNAKVETKEPVMETPDAGAVAEPDKDKEKQTSGTNKDMNNAAKVTNGETVAKQKDASEDVFNKYIDNVLVDELGRFDYSKEYIASEEQEFKQSGILNSRVADYDSDGKYELLVFFIAGDYEINDNVKTAYPFIKDNENSRKTVNMLVARMYEIIDDTVTLSDELSLDTIFSYKDDDTKSIIGAAHYAGKVAMKNRCLLYESHRENSDKDETYKAFLCYYYQNNQFIKAGRYAQGDPEVSGNADNEAEKIMNKSGLTYSGTMIDALEKVDMLFNYSDDNSKLPIESKINLTFDNGSKYSEELLNNRVKEYVKYISFSDKYMSQDVTESIEAMIVSAAAVNLSSDYIVKDGNDNILLIPFDEAALRVKNTFGIVINRQQIEDSESMKFEQRTDSRTENQDENEYISINIGAGDRGKTTDVLDISQDGNDIHVKLVKNYNIFMTKDAYEVLSADEKQNISILDEVDGGYMVTRNAVSEIVLNQNSASSFGYIIKSYVSELK